MSLAKLPSELLNHIACYFDLARTLHHFSLTCRRLYEYTLEDGFRVFVQNRFPSIKTPPYWRDATHSLTTLGKAWDRKSLIARCLRPDKNAVHLPEGRASSTNQARQNQSQSMGFQPVIDCFEEWTSGNWESRKEVLAWGAGAELVLRVRRKAHKSEDRSGKDDERKGTTMHWFTWKEAGLKEGVDDITSLNLLRPQQDPRDHGAYHLVLGRASGRLERVSLSRGGVTTIPFETNDRPVRSAHISAADSPLLAACLSDGAVALYPATSSSTPIAPIGEMTVVEPEISSRTWVTCFLDSTRLAIGRGPSLEPICIYDATPYGMSALQKIRTDARSTSVYAILPLSPSGLAGSSRDLILSGWYSGEVKLHDLRSPLPLVTTYHDPVDVESAIYSLCSFGQERFLAGGARHSILKVFDFRMPGGKAYYAADLDACSADPALISPDECCKYHEESRSVLDYNLFLGNDVLLNTRYGIRRQSPVYSLSAASNFSPSVYAGVENNVIQMDLVSMMDKHPDPGFQSQGRWTGSRDKVFKTKDNPYHDVLKLVAVEHTFDRGVRLMKQVPVGRRTQGIKGWDERWVRQGNKSNSHGFSR